MTCKLPNPYMTRDEAKSLGLIKYMRGTPCRKGHIGFRTVSNDSCVHCRKVISANYRSKPETKVRDSLYRKIYYEARKDNPDFREKVRLTQKRTREKNPNTRRKWREKNKERELALEHARRRRNPQQFIDYQRKRSERVDQATPDWLSEEHHYQMVLIYEERDKRNLEGSEVWEVDHVVPIQGKKVCGLHVPWNLQVTTRAENRAKRNHFNTSDGQFQELIQVNDGLFKVECQPNRLSRY